MGATMGDRTRLLTVPFACAEAWLVRGMGLAPRLALAGRRILPEEERSGLPGIAVAAFNGTGRVLWSMALAKLFPLLREGRADADEDEEDDERECCKGPPAAAVTDVDVVAPRRVRSVAVGGVPYRLLPPLDAALLPPTTLFLPTPKMPSRFISSLLSRSFCISRLLAAMARAVSTLARWSDVPGAPGYRSLDVA